MSSNRRRSNASQFPSDNPGPSSRQQQNDRTNEMEWSETDETAPSSEEIVFPRYDERDSHLFPRCEFCTRFNGTSAFEMSESEYWGTYFRSTSRGGNCDRHAKKESGKSGKTRRNSLINEDKSSGRVGNFHSPYESDEYRKAFEQNPCHNDRTLDECSRYFNIYDDILKYKLEMCGIVVREFNNIESKKYISVYCENDYPCIMVQVKAFVDIKSEQSSLYEIAVAYLTAIINYFALFEEIPIELVIRSSFGHNIPTISETATSLRINIGIIPKMYAERVLAKGLIVFNDIFPKLLEHELQFEVDKMNRQIETYNKYKNAKYKVEAWLKADTVFDLLKKIGDSGNHKVSYQIMRQKRYVDLLCNYVHHELRSKDRIENADFVAPLERILSQLNYNFINASKEMVVSLTVKESDYKFPKITVKENDEIKKELEFWEIHEKISSRFGENPYRVAVRRKKLFGLFSFLEEANLEFIRKSSDPQREDDPGSDSDSEIILYDHNKYKTCRHRYNCWCPRFGCSHYSKKVTVATGMRAINYAKFLVTCLVETKNVQIDTTFMYYETEKSIKETFDMVSSFDLENFNDRRYQKIVRFIDLNHCSAAGENSKVNIKEIANEISNELQNNSEKYMKKYEKTENLKEQIIILDCTSATTAKIGQAIKMFAPIVKVILLVSSGIKNEQLGADMNPYGTIRIITDEKRHLNKLHYMLTSVLKNEKLPKQLHDVRRSYKRIGAALTSKMIFSADQKWNIYQVYRRSHNDDSKNQITDINARYLRKFFRIFFCDKYKFELRRLLGMGRKVNEIIDWDDEKIAFFGSDEVEWIARYNSPVFDYIQKLYDEDPEHKIKKTVAYCKWGIWSLLRAHNQNIIEILKWDIEKITFLGSLELRSLIDDGICKFHDIQKLYDDDDPERRIEHVINKFGKEVRKLVRGYEQKLSEIVKWDDRKIAFLVSYNVNCLVHCSIDAGCHNIFNDIRTMYDEDSEKIEYIIDNLYDELRKLLSDYELNLNEIVKWDVKKIKFLGSNKVKLLIEDNTALFHDIRRSYDEDHEHHRIQYIINYFREEIDTLVHVHEQNINDIVEWDDKAIKLLGSETEMSLLIKDGYFKNFDNLLKQYFKDPHNFPTFHD